MRWCMLCVICGALLVSGCSKQSEPQSVSSDSPQADPHAGMLSAGETSNSAAMPSSAGTGRLVELDTITLTAPADWKRIEPGSTFVAAEFLLPRSEGDDQDGRLTVSAAGGSVEANIERWKSQFDPLIEEKTTQTIEVAGKSITVVDLSGDFNDSRGPFAPPVKRSDYRMIAAIIPGEGQSYFVKATGPKNSMAAYSNSIREFIRSIEPVQK